MKTMRLPLGVVRFFTLFMPVLLFLVFLVFVVVPEQNRLANEAGVAGSANTSLSTRN